MLYLIAVIVIVLNFIEVKMSDRHQRGRVRDRVPVVELLEEAVVERQLFQFQFLQNCPDPEKVRLC